MVQAHSRPDDEPRPCLMPLAESCPAGNVIVHFPVQKSDYLIWAGMYLNSMEAMEFGMHLIECAEASLLQEHDS